MKLLAIILILPMAAFAVTVTPLHPSEYADTEVSTNIAFVVERLAMTRIEFTVALDATPSNNVEVAIGSDANGDGNLSVVEAAYAFGYDCGRWFCRDRDANKTEEAIAKPCRGCISEKCTCEEMDKSASFCAFHGNAPTGNRGFAIASESSAVDLNLQPQPRLSHTFILKKRQLDTAWNLVKVTRRGCGTACELVKAEGKLPGFKLEVR